MNKVLILLLVLAFCMALPLMAQQEQEKAEKKAEKETAQASIEEPMAPPQPLDNEFMSWIVGEWKGTSESAMGTSEDHYVFNMGLGGQFLTMVVNSNMNGQKFEGMGALTLNKQGEIVGYWIDNWRSMSEGKGSIETNKATVVWSFPQGKYERVTEKVDEDNFTVHGKMTMADGKVTESTAKLTRVKKEDVTKK